MKKILKKSNEVFFWLYQFYLIVILDIINLTNYLNEKPI